MFEEPYSSIRRAESRVGLTESRVEIGSKMRADTLVLERGFEALDRVEVIAALSGSEPETE